MLVLVCIVLLELFQVYVLFFLKKTQDKMCWFWTNTAFVEGNEVTLTKEEIDDAGRVFYYLFFNLFLFIIFLC